MLLLILLLCRRACQWRANWTWEFTFALMRFVVAVEGRDELTRRNKTIMHIGVSFTFVGTWACSNIQYIYSFNGDIQHPIIIRIHSIITTNITLCFSFILSPKCFSILRRVVLTHTRTHNRKRARQQNKFLFRRIRKCSCHAVTELTFHH